MSREGGIIFGPGMEKSSSGRPDSPARAEARAFLNRTREGLNEAFGDIEVVGESASNPTSAPGATPGRRQIGWGKPGQTLSWAEASGEVEAQGGWCGEGPGGA